MRELPAESRAQCRAAVEAAVQQHWTGSREPRLAAERRRRWRVVKSLAASKTVIGLCSVLRKLASEERLDPDINHLLALVDQLEALPKKAEELAFGYGARNRKMRLRVALVRAWTDAGGKLGHPKKDPYNAFCAKSSGR